MKKILIGVAVIAVVGVLVMRGWGDRDERLIRKAFAELAEAAEFEAREDTVKAAVRSRVIAGYFEPDASVQVPGLPMTVSSRADLIALVFQLRSRMDELRLELRDVEVDVSPDRQTAQLTVTARAHVRGMGQEDAMWKEAEIDWTKTQDDGWRISAMRSIEPIERR